MPFKKGFRQLNLSKIPKILILVGRFTFLLIDYYVNLIWYWFLFNTPTKQLLCINCRNEKAYEDNPRTYSCEITCGNKSRSWPKILQNCVAPSLQDPIISYEYEPSKNPVGIKSLLNLTGISRVLDEI